MNKVIPLHPAAHPDVNQAEEALVFVERAVSDLMILAPADVAQVFLREGSGVIPARARLTDLIGQLICLRNDVMREAGR